MEARRCLTSDRALCGGPAACGGCEPRAADTYWIVLDALLAELPTAPTPGVGLPARGEARPPTWRERVRNATRAFRSDHRSSTQ
ncbi:hypothetical protein SAMN05421505_120138 [Sinosporangium album]|uniref:Uncharacterized protein n=1 Tax=Sinosporangium album TaxID=504805 RepID=A0A1G8EKD7_9ACTN|nr:hypothetical protein [Sinosporangium album]SDH70347.1 hypothetical protein SAMN05421505_120138 [Sinosporangium album]